MVIFAPIIFSSHTFYLKSGIFKKSGATLILGILVLSLPSVLINQNVDGLAIISRYLILLGLLLGFYWALTFRLIYEKLPLILSFVLSITCLITIYDWILGGYLLSYNGDIRLYKIGFSTTRTGWSSGLACCAVFLSWQFLISRSARRYLYLLAFVLIIFSQLASGGRGGLLSSLLGSFLLYIYYGKYHHLIVLLLIGALFSYFNQEMLLEHLRFDRLAANSGGDFSSGRLDHYILALEVLRTPMDFIFGLGSNGYQEYFYQQSISNEIHNVWLRLLVEYGFLLPLFIICFIGYSILVFCTKNRNKKECIGVIFVLISGLIPTMVEPNAVIFSYQNYLIWWLLFVCIRMNTVHNFIRTN